jgi:hypothetical protein
MAKYLRFSWEEYLELKRIGTFGDYPWFEGCDADHITVEFPNNKAWFYRDAAKWTAFEDTILESISRPDELFPPPLIERAWQFEVATEEQFLAIVADVQAGGYHGGCLAESV